MGKPDTEYLRNLEYFNQHSDEDVIIPHSFLKYFSKRYKGPYNNLHWLDVGTGPARKNIGILNGARGCSGLIERFSNIILDIVEPSKAWQTIMMKRFKEERMEHILGNRYQLRWEEFKNIKKYNLITFFHSVYGIQTKSLAHIPSFLQKDGCACIVVESSNSALNKLKRSIFPHVHHQELVTSHETITSFLKDAGIKFELEREESDQKFYVGDILDSNNPDRMTPISFILQTKPEDQNRTISKNVLDMLETEIMKYVKRDEDGKSYINVPDRFIWVYKL